jgi:peptidoglycan/xylan/chitin deacetylase (PgdA/CDA1 family)
MGRMVRELASRSVRQAQAVAYGLTGRTARSLSLRAGSAAILMYHRVIADAEDATSLEAGMFVRASTFERHVVRLKEMGMVGILGDLVRRPPRPDDPPRAVLTLDDGWRDNLTVAWPILDRHAVRATIFLVRDLSSAGRNAEGEFLRPDEVRDLAAKGMEFGAHTATHPFLDLLGSDEAEREMRTSKEAVEGWTGRPCELFAYPAGRFNGETPAIARALFRASVTVRRGWWTRDCDWALVPRIAIHEDMTRTRSMFEARLAGLI